MENRQRHQPYNKLELDNDLWNIDHALAIKGQGYRYSIYHHLLFGEPGRLAYIYVDSGGIGVPRAILFFHTTHVGWITMTLQNQ